MKLDNFRIIPDINKLDEYIALAKEKNLAFEYNDFFLPDVLDDMDRVTSIIDTYNEAFDRLDYHRTDHTMHGAFLDITIFSSDRLIVEASRKRIEQSMEIAKRMKVKGIVFHTNFIASFKDDNYYSTFISRNVEYFEELMKQYPDIEIYMENMFDEEPYLLSRVAEALGPSGNFGICLDYAHVNVFGKYLDREAWLECCRPYIKHLHINDNDTNRDSHMALGEGRIDYKYFFDYYKKYLSDVSVLIEVNGLENAKKSIEYIESI